VTALPGVGGLQPAIDYTNGLFPGVEEMLTADLRFMLLN